MMLKRYDYIVNKEGFLNDQEIDQLQNFVSFLPAEQAAVGSNTEYGIVEKKHRDSIVKWVSPNQHTLWLHEKITSMIHEVNDNFFHMDLSLFEVLQHTTYQAPGGYYGPHIDSFMNTYPARKMSFSIQLSNDYEYEGGDVLIYQNNMKFPYKASRKRGDLIVFFSMMMHEVTPVTKGTRQSLVGWVAGPHLK